MGHTVRGEEGLTGGGEHAEAMAELRKIKAKLAKRAAQETRRERRKKRKQALTSPASPVDRPDCPATSGERDIDRHASATNKQYGGLAMRWYRYCPECRRRMRRVGKEGVVPLSSPPLVDRYFYQCPCGCEWTYYSASNFLEPRHQRCGSKGKKAKQRKGQTQ
jgi:hypothetical protein